MGSLLIIDTETIGCNDGFMYICQMKIATISVDFFSHVLSAVILMLFFQSVEMKKCE